ncbi:MULTISPECIES: indolepyruvate ferredoxin oxidoreductase family protein [Prauserella salsuginis group]|uniref:Indolepyruvate ferredoxin oxidoreductase family protein n=1 Tax=Prauserella salsuginis TaxID=387889 RepID=A0ABW6G0L6_9PSEU|nr:MULTISPECIES: indolepyruvate ferredoxin oxidoreductase family protein [Prauserella salsuginis group]MCR3721910.1 indolepyruvate ferredoxin oxidoreductase [Prauserella flava]MCR3735915.1 indolepyruvate ferredoxin oxidoreductase [Prauserella salsuginis]
MSFSLDDRYTLREGTAYLTGIQALVRLVRDNALADRRRGMRTGSLVSGYEGSPLAGYDMELSRRADLFADLDHVHLPGVNEELAATSVMGSQLADQAGDLQVDGVTGYWYGKTPGLDRASDALRHANLIGTHPRGGAVALVGDDPAGKSSSLPGSSELALADLQMPTLYPADAEDVLGLGRHAVEMSRHTGLWSAMKITTAVADGACTASLPGEGTSTRPTVLSAGDRHRPDAMLGGSNLVTLERSQVSQRLPRALEYASAHNLNRMLAHTSDDRVGLVCAGKTYLDVRDALDRLGLSQEELEKRGIRLLHLAMIWPLDHAEIREFARGLQEIVVVEEKRPFLEDAIRNVLYGVPDAPRVLGKVDDRGRELVSPVGELDADQVATALARRLGDVHGIESALEWREKRPRTRTALPLLARTPYFCSGCPHNSSTKVPEDTIVGGGIGCHAMVLFTDDKQTGQVLGLTQMGGEGSQWLGIAPFVAHNHFVQNIGDGTFTHSGSLALRAAVASGANITYKLLYNATVAMTGGQDPVGELSLSRLTRLLLAEGVSKVVVTSEDPRRARRQGLPSAVEVRDRDDVVHIQQELSAVPGVTVLIHDQECAAETRRKRKRGLAETPRTRVMINERICEGCGDCGEKSNCMSVRPVETEFGRKTRIHQSSCNLDYSCMKGDCPSFVTITVGKEKPKRTRAADITAEILTEPEEPAQVDTTDYNLRITGIGGTGVVTIAQIIATAAVIDGRDVRCLDQTGLAQKGGAVVSDIRITHREVASKIPESECDLYLVCDSLVGTDPTNLKGADPGRTTVVASTAEVPTGQMVVDTGIRFPSAGLVSDSLESVARRKLEVDAAKLAESLFGHEQYANMLLVGVAWQLGRLPVSAKAMEHAISLNGAAAETNIQAFRRGRQLVCDPASVESSIRPQRVSQPLELPDVSDVVALAGAAPGTELARLLNVRVPDLADYADTGYARVYANFVARVRERENAAVPGSTAVAEAVARNLYKLMAYKDEYEIARLVLRSHLDETVAQEFGADARYQVQLHPPMLRAMGMSRKIGFGARSRSIFTLLRNARRLRGTGFDIFGRHPVRRMERELITEYRAAIDDALQYLTPDSLTTVVELAELPDQIRGYEQIKIDNVAAYRSALAQAQADLESISKPSSASNAR